MAKMKLSRRMTPGELAKLQEKAKRMYEEGKSLRQIAKDTGRAYSTIHKVLSEQGVTLRPRGGNTYNKRKNRQEQQ